MKAVKRYYPTELSRMLGISRQSVYNKFDRDMPELVHKDEHGRFILEDGLERLKAIAEDMFVNAKPKLDSSKTEESNSQESMVELLNAHNKHLMQTIEDLKKQLDVKDAQIANIQRLFENSQILQKSSLTDNIVAPERKSLLQFFFRQ